MAQVPAVDLLLQFQIGVRASMVVHHIFPGIVAAVPLFQQLIDSQHAHAHVSNTVKIV